MEEQTLHYYLKAFKILLIIFLSVLCIFYIYINNKKIITLQNPINIDKNERIESIIENNIINVSFLEIIIIKSYYYALKIILNKFIHFGEFYIEKNSTLRNFLITIFQPSNVLNKITIIEGWSKKDLNIELSKYFDEFYEIPYDAIIADTYFFEKNKSFELFVTHMSEIKTEYLNKFKNNKFSNKFTNSEIITIGSLLEKEGLDREDKLTISSVILNRLDLNLRLQIDATVLYAITNGDYNLNRKLLLKDLKIDHPFNTYRYYGLPPKPISYVGKETIDIIFENYKTDFLFYFFNYSLNRHIFSENYKEHQKKLNEYRKNK